MRKYYQYFGLALIMVFSFYYTEQISRLVMNKNPLMVTIHENADDYMVEAVSAVIDGEYITPGITGQKVNERESFYKMQSGEVFNKYFLVFDKIQPDLSLKDNKDKLIRHGNYKLNKVSFILEEENNIINYFKTNNISASLLVELDSYKKNSYFEAINNEIEGFKSLENNLNLNKENKHICVVNDLNKKLCMKAKNYLVEPELKLNTTNLLDIKKNIDNGSIIYINSDAKLEDVIYLIKEVKYKGLEIVKLSELISEEQDY